MAVTAGNLYQDLESELQDFKKFLTDNQAAIQTAVKSIKLVVPRVGTLLSDLIDLMVKLRAEIDKIDVTSVAGTVLDTVSSLTKGATTVLTTAESLLSNEKDAIDKVLGAINVVSDLPSFNTLKKDIEDLIDAIVALLKTINS